jgi:hypothetical protein
MKFAAAFAILASMASASLMILRQEAVVTDVYVQPGLRLIICTEY